MQTNPKKPMKKKPMKTMKEKKKPMKTMKKKPMKTMKMMPMKKNPTKGVVVGTALMGKQTKTTKNKKRIHVDSRYVKEIWVQVEVVQDKALVKVWKKDD